MLFLCILHSHADFCSIQGLVIWNDSEYRNTQTWSIACDRLLSCSAVDGTTVEMRQGDITLLVTVRRLPHFNLVEEVLDPKSNKFVLRMNSETSVWFPAALIFLCLFVAFTISNAIDRTTVVKHPRLISLKANQWQKHQGLVIEVRIRMMIMCCQVEKFYIKILTWITRPRRYSWQQYEIAKLCHLLPISMICDCASNQMQMSRPFGFLFLPIVGRYCFSEALQLLFV